MKNVFNFLMEFNAEDIKNYYDDQPEWNEDLQPRLSQSQVFDNARLLQASFHDVDPYDIETAKQVMPELARLVSELDNQAAQAELQGKPARLYGDKVGVPRIQYNSLYNLLAVNAFQPKDDDKVLYETKQALEGMSGEFYGFTIEFQKNNNGERDLFLPQVAYQLRLPGQTTLNNIEYRAIATGVVGDTTLSFDSDRRLDAAHNAPDQLFQLNDTTVNQSLNALGMLLHSDKLDHPTALSRIGYNADRIMRQLELLKRPELQDAVIDLIQGSIEPGADYYFDTNSWSYIDQNGETYQPVDGQPSRVQTMSTLEGFIFQTRKIATNEGAKPTKYRMLHLVCSPNGSSRWYFPVAKINRYRKLPE